MQDQPNIFINDCLVHNRVSYPDLEAAERERMWEARAAERERSASLPSGDISVRPGRLGLGGGNILGNSHNPDH